MDPKLAPMKQLFDRVRGYLAAKEDPLLKRILADIPTSPEPRILPPRRYPVTNHFTMAKTHAGGAADRATDGLLLDLSQGMPRFHWNQSYSEEDFGPAFLENYGFLELLGTRGHFVSDRLACGFLAIGPNTEYAAHRHAADEIYVVVAGTAQWRKGKSRYIALAPGSVIHHPSQVVHAMKTNAEALLAFYIWRGGDLAQKSEIGLD
jgi:mannose-6-phosphate isomerase-like protein (cupin superfamily)